MLRSTNTFRLLGQRSFHSVSFQAAAAPSRTKALARGYKKGGEGKKSKKNSGSAKFFQEHVHNITHGKNGAKLSELIPQLSEISLLEGSLETNTVVNYTEKQRKRLIQAGSFKKDQFNELFSSPVTLIRDDTKKIETFINNSFETSSKNNRLCLLGERGIGKSVLLAQAQAIATNEANSIILPIPYALKLVDGSNDYWFDPVLKTYIQPMYLKNLLDRIESVNASSLSKLKLSQNYTIDSGKNKPPLKFTTNQSLLQLLQSKKTPRQRGQIFQILIEELQNQSKSPVLITIDNFSALTSNPITPYRNTENEPLYLEEFQISKTLFEFISGDKEFQKGGILLSTSSDDKPSITLKAGLGLTKPDPYLEESKFNRTLASRLKGVEPYTIGKLTKENVGSLVERLIEVNAFNKLELESSPKDLLINQKYFLSGNGNPLELIKSITMHY